MHPCMTPRSAWEEWEGWTGWTTETSTRTCVQLDMLLCVISSGCHYITYIGVFMTSLLCHNLFYGALNTLGNSAMSYFIDSCVHVLRSYNQIIQWVLKESNQ